jgi:DUF1680 family protein
VQKRGHLAFPAGQGDEAVRAEGIKPGTYAAPYDSPVLYKEFDPDDLRPVRLRLIPYYAWANRGVSQMTVWIPLD